MPRTAVDYSKTIIYKLVHKDDYDNANVYVGSTTDFTRRKNKHKTCCNNEKSKEYNEKKYQYIRANGGWNEWEMVLLERHNCNDGNEARAKEEYWRCHFNAKLNMLRAYRTEEQVKGYQKEYREKNKEQAKEYYEQHKGKILEQKSQQITCECGCIITKVYLAKHEKTKNHINLLNGIPNNDI